MAGSSTESVRAWAALIERTSSHGAESGWQRLGPYTLPDATIGGSRRLANKPTGQVGSLGPFITTGVIQPTVLSLGGNHLRFYRARLKT